MINYLQDKEMKKILDARLMRLKWWKVRSYLKAEVFFTRPRTVQELKVVIEYKIVAIPATWYDAQ
jgi:hypothetical protein